MIIVVFKTVVGQGIEAILLSLAVQLCFLSDALVIIIIIIIIIRVFRWNDVDVLFNLELDLKLPFSQSHKIPKICQHYAIDGYHFVLDISHRLVIIELKIVIRVFSWDDVDVLFTFKIDLKLTFSQKDTNISTLCH